jgi:hypothetical protein
MPFASSLTIKNCEEQTYDAESISESASASSEGEKSTCGGTIYGYTLEFHDTWGAYPVPLALVDAGIKQTISDPIMGYYRITGLLFDKEITITASKIGYTSDTIRHTFTEGDQPYYYCFDLQEKDDHSVKDRVSNNNDKGRIYGYTVSSQDWSWNPISNVLVTTGLQGKSTISDGYYSISGLPLNVPIRVTARKIGYYFDSKTVTLTNEDPEEYLILDLQPFMGKSEAKNIGIMNDLFSLVSLGSNARSYFFSTFTLMS